MLKTLAIATCAATLASSAFAAPRFQEAVIEEVKVTPEQAGNNPDAFSYLIETKVLLGSNACIASGVKAHISKRNRSNSLNILAIKRMPLGPLKICAQVWAPVYSTIRTRVKGLRTRTKQIFVHNVGEIGAVKSIEQMLQSGQLIALKGPLTRVMASGGESTGIAIQTSNGDFVELDLLKHGFQRRIEEFEDKVVIASGKLARKAGIEISERVILIVEDIRVVE